MADKVKLAVNTSKQIQTIYVKGKRIDIVPDETVDARIVTSRSGDLYPDFKYTTEVHRYTPKIPPPVPPGGSVEPKVPFKRRARRAAVMAGTKKKAVVKPRAAKPIEPKVTSEAPSVEKPVTKKPAKKRTKKPAKKKAGRGRK